MATGPENHPRRDEILEKLRKLAEVSKDLEQNARMQAAAVNLVQAGELRRRVDELTRRQDALVLQIVERHPDAGTRDRFLALTRRIEEFRPQIRSCQDPEELKRLKQDIDHSVEDWVHQFQTIVSALVGVAPPAGPMVGPSPF